VTLPNILTLSRLVFAALIVWLLCQYSLAAYVAAAVLFAAGALTDFYDGHLAKKSGLTSDFGKIMDPIADKVLMLSVFFALAYTTDKVNAGMVALIAVREICVTASRLRAMSQGQVLAAEKAGKIKTVFQIISICVVLLFLIAEESPWTAAWFFQVQSLGQGVINFLMVVTVFLTVGSGVAYFKNQWTNSQKS